MTELLEEKDTHLSNFARLEREFAGKPRPWVHRIRTAAISRFAELGLPSNRDEEWRFTNVAPIAKTRFRPANGDELEGVTTKQISRFTLDAFDSLGVVLVFVNGRLSEKLSSFRHLPDGVNVGSLAAALESDRDQVEPYLARFADYKDHGFVALNTAFIEDGAFVYVPTGKVVEQPIHLLFVSTSSGEPAVSHPRNLIVAGDNSQLAIIESYIGLDGGVYFTNAVTEIAMGQNAVIDHYKVQHESTEAFHIATLAVHQDRNSNFRSHSISLGGAIARNEIRATLDAEGIECTLNGLYMATDRQLVDHHTTIDHAKPHCNSHEVYKGVLDGKSRGVFSGKIIVRQDAQKTNAKQTNKNLLLSADAMVDTKPQLQIYADDVKCTHGATIGQLDADSIFYLRSRGIGHEDARHLLTCAFASEIIAQIRIAPLRDRLEELMLTRLQKSAAIKEGS